MSAAIRFSLFPDGLRPAPNGRWIKYLDYEALLELLEGFADLYGEVPLMGEMIAHGHPLWKRYHALSGDHMIMTDEGWEPGEAKASYLEEYGAASILDEVNMPSASGDPLLRRIDRPGNDQFDAPGEA